MWQWKAQTPLGGGRLALEGRVGGLGKRGWGGRGCGARVRTWIIGPESVDKIRFLLHLDDVSAYRYRRRSLRFARPCSVSAPDILEIMPMHVYRMSAGIVVVDYDLDDFVVVEDLRDGVVAVDQRVGGFLPGGEDGHKGGNGLGNVGQAVH